MGSGLEEELRGVATSLEDWSTNVLGDLEKRLRKAKELERLRREPISDLAVGREVVWSSKVDWLEEQIDTYWKQRAYVNWLHFGDRNTKYFHNACSVRKRRNRMGRMLREDGSWAEEEGEKKILFLTIFCSFSVPRCRQMRGNCSA